MTILVTGGSGFVGRNIRSLWAGKYKLIAPPSRELDMTDTARVDAFFSSHRVDVVIHCAMVGHGLVDDPADSVEQNTRMVTNILRQKNQKLRIILVGSGAEYGKSRPLQRVAEKEWGQIVPTDRYGFSKYLCSLLGQGDSRVTILRPFGLFGKYEDYHRRFISNALCRALFDMPITIEQNVFFDYVWIDDFVRIVDYFITHKLSNKTYNIGTGKRIDLVSIAKRVLSVTGKKLPIQVAKPGFKDEYTCDTSRLMNELPDFQFTDFDDTLRQLYRYYQNNKNALNKDRLKYDAEGHYNRDTATSQKKPVETVHSGADADTGFREGV